MITPDYPDKEGHITLDARVSNKLGRELQTEINDSVGHTQLFVLKPLPDILLVTQKQFASLQPYTEKMYETEDRMFQTPHNVMEVQIDREYQTDNDIEGVMIEVDKLKKEIHDHDADTDTTDDRG